MVGQKQFHHQLPGFANFLGIGADHHAVGHGKSAGRGQGPGALNFHHADAAAGIGLDVEVMAEGRNMHTDLTGRRPDGDAGRNGYGLAVNG